MIIDSGEQTINLDHIIVSMSITQTISLQLSSTLRYHLDVGNLICTFQFS